MLWLFASMSYEVPYHLLQLLLATSSLLTTTFFVHHLQVVTTHSSFSKFSVKYPQQMIYFMILFLRTLTRMCVLCLFLLCSYSGVAFRHNVQEALESSGPTYSQSSVGKQNCSQQYCIILTGKILQNLEGKRFRQCTSTATTFLSSLPEYFRISCGPEVPGQSSCYTKLWRSRTPWIHAKSHLNLFACVAEWVRCHLVHYITIGVIYRLTVRK